MSTVAEEVFLPLVNSHLSFNTHSFEKNVG